jgi:AcrR family transcriptional regulator
MVSTQPGEESAAGRPRDPDIDRRIIAAATSLFGRVGWAGFTFEAVAREAGIGKPSLYLRWKTKEQLLSGALRAGIANIDDVDTGEIRSDLVELARQLLMLYLGPGRWAVERMKLEAQEIPGVADRWESLRDSQVRAARAMVHRAIDRGELPAATSVTLLLDTFFGAVTMHAQSTPARLRRKVSAEADDYAKQLVDFLLHAVTTTTSG